MAFGKKENEVLEIKAPSIARITLRIESTAPLVVNKFSEKAKQQMLDTMSTAKADKKSKAARPPRDYEAEFAACQHRAEEGWPGIPCSAFRAAMVAACRTIALPMTQAKMAVFVQPAGFDVTDGTPLVRIESEVPPEKSVLPVRNQTGVADIRVRAMWRHWQANVVIDFDSEMINASSIANLLARAGQQVGLCEGRPFSKSSIGMGWGTFHIVRGDQPKSP